MRQALAKIGDVYQLKACYVPYAFGSCHFESGYPPIITIVGIVSTIGFQYHKVLRHQDMKIYHIDVDIANCIRICRIK